MSKVKHIVLLKFKDGTADDQIERVLQDVLDSTETIPGIEDYVSGPNSSPEAMNQGYTHALIMTFTDAAARDAYLPHPDNARVKSGLEAVADSMLVFDFEV